jgi:malonate-semialdehyde dehydrogenase (acetylating)/methylmalonate-semialdehyde dehydrogenase
MKVINHWVGGRQLAGTSGRQGPVFDPALGRQQALVDLASVAEVDHVVAVARQAAASWRQTSIARRTEVLFALRELVVGQRRELAALISAEHGKVNADALGEVARGIENLEFACGIGTLLKGGYSEQAATGVDVHAVRQPVGVVACITPFNFPVMVPMWMFATALACGNTVVLKPSEKTPSACLLLGQLMQRAGLPDGCFNVVQGDRIAADRLLAHPDIDAISFVGSTPVARHVYETGTRHGKRVQALGGAKNHMLVLADADLDAAADAAVSAAFGSTGERCMAVSVLLVAEPVADALIERIRTRMAAIVVGPASQVDAAMGPLITREHRDAVAAHIANATTDGARVLVDGRADVPAEGWFLRPSLIDNVRPGMRCYDQEIFGPVLCVMRVAGYAEGLSVINANQFGNGAALFTRDGGAARSFGVDVQAGMVGINVPVPVPVAHFSFGGWKDSLFGDQHIYGPEGVNFYTRGKVITSRWPVAEQAGVDLSFPRNR